MHFGGGGKLKPSIIAIVATEPYIMKYLTKNIRGSAKPNPHNGHIFNIS